MSELASSPVQVITFSGREKTPGKSTPLLMEFPVNAELGPFLVASSKATLWINRAFNNRVRSAVRAVPELFDYFLEIVEAVTKKGHEANWGNVHPWGQEGLEDAIEHLKSYGLSDLEILGSPDTDWGSLNPEWAVEEGDIALALLGIPVQPAPWLPPDTIVVIPKEREFVGFVLLFDTKIASVVHNASRGMAVVTVRLPE